MNGQHTPPHVVPFFASCSKREGQEKLKRRYLVSPGGTFGESLARPVCRDASATAAAAAVVFDRPHRAAHGWRHRRRAAGLDDNDRLRLLGDHKTRCWLSSVSEKVKVQWRCACPFPRVVIYPGIPRYVGVSVQRLSRLRERTFLPTFWSLKTDLQHKFHSLLFHRVHPRFPIHVDDTTCSRGQRDPNRNLLVLSSPVLRLIMT